MSPDARQAERRAPRLGGGGSRAGRGSTTDLLNGSRPSQVVAARHLPRDSALRRLLGVSDLIAVAIAGVIVLGLVGREPDPRQFLFGALLLPCWIVIFKLYGLYDRDMKRISHTTVDDLPWLFHAVIVGGLLTYLYFRVVPTRYVDGKEIFGIAALALVTVPTFRSFTRRAALRVLGPDRVLLVGDGPQVELVARKMRSHPEYRLDPVGVLTRTGTRREAGGVPALGKLDTKELSKVLTEHRIERVVVSHTDVEEEEMLALVRRCRELSIKVGVLPQVFDALGPSVEVDDVEGITVLGIAPPVLPPSSRLLKRCLDLVGATALLVVFAPLLVAIAIAMKIASGGPVFFRQERIGRGGKKFKLVKFRTMVVDAEARQDELAALSRDPHWLLLDDDPRVTRLGRLLRRSSLDELPQLWNVLKGEMSLVGPRPLPESQHSQLTGWSRARIDLTPGLTGLWQVLGRTSISFEEMIKLDYLYVTNWSLWADVRLILRTLPVVLTQRGAN